MMQVIQLNGAFATSIRFISLLVAIFREHENGDSKEHTGMHLQTKTAGCKDFFNNREATWLY